jgi:lysocardiolipin and lysophospholipid acyltransferase
MYWRRFAVSSIPLSNQTGFEQWLLERWREKDELLELWYNTGRFPSDIGAADESKGTSNEGFIETEMMLSSWLEIGQIFVVLAATALLVNVVLKVCGLFVRLS